MTVARHPELGGSIGLAVVLCKRIVTVLVALTHALKVIPAGIDVGAPTDTLAPATAPVTVTVKSEVAPAAMLG